MKTVKIITMALLAGSVIATPAFSQQQRKTLFEVLFPKAHERKVKQKRLKQEALQAAQARQQTPKVLPKVKKTKLYAYKVASLAPIKIKVAPVEFAALVTGSTDTEQDVEAVQTPQPTRMTLDLSKAESFVPKVEKHLAKAVSDFYSENQAYYWLNDQGEWNAKARSVRLLLDDAASYGLDPQDYKIKASENVETEASLDHEQRLRREIAMSVAVLRYAMDAEYGVVNPNRLSGYHDFPVFYAQSGDMLEKIAGTGLPVNVLKDLHPTNEKFAALKAELSELSGVKDDVIDLPTKILIKPGQKNVALKDFVAAIKLRASMKLLAKHAVTFASYTGSSSYSKSVVALVKDYQKEAGLGADGIIGRNTATKLAGIPSTDKVSRLKLAMERMRWLPDELGERHVFINQPEYRARYIEGGAQKLSMRVVVGKKSNQTNFFYDEIEHVVFNPYWGVPRSIIVNEFLPKSIRNPGYLDQRGYEVTTFGGKRIPSSSINWSQVGTNPNFAVRQPPGAKNALGSLKIMFPNEHAIYMHDTPAKSLFKRQNRAFSHGCVRLHDPQAMAAAVLGKSKSQINASIARGKNQTEKLKSKVPVYVSYFTAWPQEDGTVKYFADMYGRDAHLNKAMNITAKARANITTL